MKIYLAFNTIIIDTQSISGTLSSPIEFFNADDHVEEDLITQGGKHEEEIIKWLLGTRWKKLLLDELGISLNPFIDYSVERPVVEDTQKPPGDIDLLICEDHVAEHAIAFQCKAVKVTALNQDQDEVNKIPDLRQAVDRVNKQRDKFGFYKNYLAVIIKSYGAKRREYNSLSRGPTKESFKQIYEFPQRESLNSDVGLIFILIIQPTPKSYNRFVEVGICLEKEASILDQPTRLTGRIKDYMRQKGLI